MSSSKGVDAEMETHGRAVDEEKSRVKCNYCEKEVSGFNRLKHHLGGVGNDVLPCPKVPSNIKASIRDSLLEKKKERLRREVGELNHPNLPRKRVSSPSSTSSSATRRAISHANVAEPSDHATPKKGRIPQTSSSSDNANISGQSSGNRPEPSISIPTRNQFFRFPSPHVDRARGGMVNENVAKAVGGFFLEAGIDLNMVKLASFRNMIDVAINWGPGFTTPSPSDMTGWVLQEEVGAIVGRINSMRECWEQFGCTVILDSWVDRAGRSLFAFLVDCPKGTVFLKSVDVSDAVEDVDRLFALLSQVIREVGVGNVVQVITTNVSPHMQAAGQRLTDKFSVHCNSCADFCIDLMLGKIAKMDHVSQVLTTARSMTRLVYSNEAPLQLLYKHLEGKCLLKLSHSTNVAQFMTLENIISNKRNLIEMFNSPEWASIEWAYGSDARNVVEIVKRSAFWNAASNILKITNPLVGVTNEIFGPDKTPMGYLYNALDCAKEAIRIGLGGDEDVCSPYWEVIDDIWDNYLHSSIHASGYYLNPALSYSEDFDADEEVVNGLHDCNLQMARDLRESKQISRQLEAYKMHSGIFSDFAATIQTKTISPVRWWKMNGGQCRELQRFAIHVLSQPVCGAARYKLDHRMSEELHSFRGSIVEKRLLGDREFVRNNKILEWYSIADATTSISQDNMINNSLSDWVSA